jgi:hypothetical protein
MGSELAAGAGRQIQTVHSSSPIAWSSAVYTTVIGSQRNFDMNGLLMKMVLRYWCCAINAGRPHKMGCMHRS